MRKFVVDTNVFIRAMRDAGFNEAFAEWQEGLAPFILQHGVVVGELLAGASSDSIWRRWHRRWILPAERVRRVIAPSYEDWRSASRTVAKVIETGSLSPGGVPPSFLNDCLLAATAARLGHSIVTFNVRDFEVISTVMPAVEALPPFPST